MDALHDPAVEELVIMSAAQVGKSEIVLNILGYHIHQDPAPILAILPTLELAEAVSKDRIAPMIRDTPALVGLVKDPRSRDSENTLLHKRFPGGHLTLAGANSPASLSSRPIRIVLCDEVDRFPISAGSEGDPVRLAQKRSATFWNRKHVLTSTPTVKGASRIEMAWEQSDQRRYYVPCPHCGEYQVLGWSQVQWDKDEASGEPRNVRYVCCACGVVLGEQDKAGMLARGEWRAERPCNGIAGFHLSELYSPWSSWERMAREFVRAKAGGLETLRVWINTSLGETWEEPGESVEHSVLFARREAYPENARVADGVLCLTCGVDVQDDRLELEVVGWGMGEESWGIDYRVLHGDPGQQGIWTQLSDALAQGYTDSHGLRFHIASTCIDSGGHYTQIVYGFCRLHKARRIFATKGRAGEGLPIVSSPSRRRSGRNQRPVELYMIGVDGAKGLIYSRLKHTQPGPGYCHFPMQPDYDEEFFAQLTAERIQTRYHKGFARREWVKTRPRNEALDCRVGALAALYLLNPSWEALERRSRANREQATPNTPPLKKPRGPLRRPGNWVDRWKR